MKIIQLKDVNSTDCYSIPDCNTDRNRKKQNKTQAQRQRRLSWFWQTLHEIKKQNEG